MFNFFRRNKKNAKVGGSNSRLPKQPDLAADNANRLRDRINGTGRKAFEKFDAKKGKLYRFRKDAEAYPHHQLLEFTGPKMFESFDIIPVKEGDVVMCLEKKMHGKSTGLQHPIWIFLHEGKVCFMWIQTTEANSPRALSSLESNVTNNLIEMVM